MPLDLLVGASGSGRTSDLVGVARRALDSGQRVFWVSLPHQRSAVLRRMTAGGYTALGFEAMSGQQLFYRLLASGDRLKPLVTGNARLVTVAQALAEVIGALPSPGEARLYSYAIAEAKRFGLGAADLADPELEGDPEIARLALVFGAYERALGDSWDYDDVRSQAVALALARPAACEADVIIVDGLRELGPLELRLYQALATVKSVHISLPTAPPGTTATRELHRTAASSGKRVRYLLPNPVAELRFVIGSIKADLLERGCDALDLALVVPRGTAPAALALAEEYGVPLMDETPTSLSDSPEGRTLLDLVEFAEHPTPSRLLAVPGLAPLANAALEARVSGHEALEKVARSVGLEEEWGQWRMRLSQTGEPVQWANWLLDEVLPASLGAQTPPDFRKRAARMAQEAAGLGVSGQGFQAWWAALLRDTRTRRLEPGGVALLTAALATGRHYAKLYLVGATEGAHLVSEIEDYFVPEERRLELEESFTRLGLPRRFQGRAAQVAGELLDGADSVVITVAEADQDGVLTPDSELFLASGEAFSEQPGRPPRVPAASRLELLSDAGYAPPLGTAELPQPPSASQLQRYVRCPFQLWGESSLVPEGVQDGADDRGETWAGHEWAVDLRAALVAKSRHTETELAELAERFPRAATWLERHRELLLELSFGAVLTGREQQVVAAVDAGGRRQIGSRGKTAAGIYRLVAPRPGPFEWREALDLLKSDWTEMWAATVMLEHGTRAPEMVEFYLWPLLSEPHRVTDSSRDRTRSDLEDVRGRVAEALPRYLRGEIPPNPGYHCRDCRVFDVCRHGVKV